MKYQVTVPGDIASEMMARIIHDRFRGDHRRQPLTEKVVAAAEAVGFTATVSLDGVINITQDRICGRHKHIKTELTSKQLRELANVAQDLYQDPSSRFFSYDDFGVIKLKQAVRRFIANAATAIL